MHITIVDMNADLIREIEALTYDSVAWIAGDVFQAPADAIVSPANSFGFMDGGIDLAYSRRFGWGVEAAVQAKIAAEFDGELLVGQALSVRTGNGDFPTLISTPTMRVPMTIVDPSAIRLAARAAVREAQRIGAGSVVMPGLGSGAGQVQPRWAAAMMIAGINDALAPKPYPRSLLEASGDHYAAFPKA